MLVSMPVRFIKGLIITVEAGNQAVFRQTERTGAVAIFRHTLPGTVL